MHTRFFRHITFMAALFAAVACHEEQQPEPTQKPRLQSVSVSETSLVLPAEGSVEIPFRVEEPGYVFNYAVDDPNCQVQLKGKDGKTPAEFRISRIAPGTEPGLYTAVLTDLGVSTDYVREVRLLVENSNYLSNVSYMPSGYFEVRSEEAGKPKPLNTGLPVVYVDTENGWAVNSKETYVPATLRIEGTEEYEGLEDVVCEIRGRGNTTWEWPKKPYLIKMDKKQSVLGMPKHKRWVLLANFMDRTLMRNLVSMKVASLTRLAWTPRCVPVELVLNGVHKGSYLLIEQVRVDKNRVNITEMAATDNDGEAVTGGYLLELDFHFDNEVQWVDKHGVCVQRGPKGGIPFGVKYPDSEDLTDPQLTYIKNHVYDTAETLYGDGFKDPENGYAKYIDVDSFVDYWIVFEVMGNHELSNPGSVYMHKDRGGKLVAGPCWDFDWGVLSYKTSPQARTGLINGEAIWYARLFQDPAFKAKVKARFQELLPELKKIPDYMDECEKLLTESAKLNFAMWNPAEDASMNGWEIINGDENMTFSNAIALLKSNYKERLGVIPKNL
ncbi:MAG: CotH kinase family protein [Bacteroidales bacterium]|nr:CotH kinase family protein [Bacteroidales bacterium]